MLHCILRWIHAASVRGGDATVYTGILQPKPTCGFTNRANSLPCKIQLNRLVAYVEHLESAKSVGFSHP